MFVKQMRKFRQITQQLMSAIIAIGLVIFVSCGDKGSGPRDTVIIPLKVGNSWIGTLTDYDSNGATGLVDTLELRVPRDTTISGEKWFVVEGMSEGITKFGFFSILTQRENGIWFRTRFQSNDESFLLFKYPAVAGDSYNLCSESSVTTTVVSTNESVTVPSGSYSCYCYKTGLASQSIGSEIVYLAPNVGFVELELYLALGGGQEYLSIRWELETPDLK